MEARSGHPSTRHSFCIILPLAENSRHHWWTKVRCPTWSPVFASPTDISRPSLSTLSGITLVRGSISQIDDCSAEEEVGRSVGCLLVWLRERERETRGLVDARRRRGTGRLITGSDKVDRRESTANETDQSRLRKVLNVPLRRWPVLRRRAVRVERGPAPPATGK